MQKARNPNLKSTSASQSLHWRLFAWFQASVKCGRWVKRRVWEGVGVGVTRTKCTPRSHANQSLAFYCRNPIWHIYKGSVWGLWLANLIIDGCLLRLASLFANMRVEVFSSKYLWQLGDPSPPLAVPHCRLMIPQRAIFKVPNTEWTCCPLYFPMISQPAIFIPLSPLSLPLSLSLALSLSCSHTHKIFICCSYCNTTKMCQLYTGEIVGLLKILVGIYIYSSFPGA